MIEFFPKAIRKSLQGLEIIKKRRDEREIFKENCRYFFEIMKNIIIRFEEFILYVNCVEMFEPSCTSNHFSINVFAD